MVVSMMKWMPWPQLPSKKFEANIKVHRMSSVGIVPFPLQECSRFSVEVKWKGPKGITLSSLKRSLRRNITREELLKEDGVVCWDEEFRSLCSFSVSKDGHFLPWKVYFTVLPGPSKETNNKFHVLRSAPLNLAEFISSSNTQDSEISIPLSLPGATISLHISVSLLELRNSEDPRTRSVLSLPRSPFYCGVSSFAKEEISMSDTSPKRVDIFRGISILRSRRGHDESSSDGRSSENQFNHSPDFDSFGESDETESDKGDPGFRKSFNYGTLIYANHAGDPSSSEDDDLVYYSHRSPSKENNTYSEDDSKVPVPVPSHPSQQNLKLLLLPWSKRKSPPSDYKGEPLIKKHYGEEGGDDIDFDRRQLRSSIAIDQSSSAELLSEFGDDNFAIGKWENKEITSRDGLMKLKTQVFFASIDQRSERAAGESACTALVAVIADWFHTNHNEQTPIKSQLDTLIREGSLEWRKLCEQPSYAERFPDKHFDLETVLEAGIRPLSVVPEKSFVGFFHPQGVEEEERLSFLQCAMNFDSIWDEIRESATEIPPSEGPLVYIISWNDHFFVLKVEADAYYIIDTLGERLHEGCDRAFILKFDEHTEIHRADTGNKTVHESVRKEVSENNTDDDDNDPNGIEEKGNKVRTGKEMCREYIKSFLAAIPVRELQEDLKRGRIASTTSIHHRLQIECHYTTHFWNNLC